MLPSRPYHAFTAYHREPGGLRRLDFFVDCLAAWRGERRPQAIRILDIGCGNGNITLPLASLGYDVTGVDQSRDAMQRAQATASSVALKLRLLHGSIELVQNETFDVILASEVLEHLDRPAAFLQELRKICAPDGLLLVSVPNGWSLEECCRRVTTHTRLGRWIKHHVKLALGNADLQSIAVSPHEHFFSWSALTGQLYLTGWKVKHEAASAAWFKEFFYLGARAWFTRGSHVFHTLDAWDAALASRLPRWLADGWLLEARPFDSTRPLVAQIVTTLAAGGAEGVVYELARRLPEHGFDTQVVVLMGGGPLQQTFANADVAVTIFEKRGPFGAWSFFRLRDFLRRERPAIVHTHLFGADVWGRLAAWMQRVPVIVSTEHNVNRQHGWLKRAIKSLLAHLTQALVAVSSEVKTYMQIVEGIPSKKIHLIRYGIDLSHSLPRPLQLFHAPPRLITIGRLVAQKDHATLLRALALVKPAWSLDVIGTGELELTLKKLAQRLGIAPRIRWLGYRQDVAQLLSESDLFCFPSRWEGLGLAFIEAAAAGVPIIASDLPVFHEVLQSSEATYVPVGDATIWATTIETMLQDPSECIRRAQHALLKVKQRYEVSRMVKGYAKLYAELLLSSVQRGNLVKKRFH